MLGTTSGEVHINIISKLYQLMPGLNLVFPLCYASLRRIQNKRYSGEEINLLVKSSTEKPVSTDWGGPGQLNRGMEKTVQKLAL
jgi:hypothetical protein